MVRMPTHPGEMLLTEFLTPMNMTQRELADAIQVPCQQINEIFNGKGEVTPSSALRLAKLFGFQQDAALKNCRDFVDRVLNVIYLLLRAGINDTTIHTTTA